MSERLKTQHDRDVTNAAAWAGAGCLIAGGAIGLVIGGGLANVSAAKHEAAHEAAQRAQQAINLASELTSGLNSSNTDSSSATRMNVMNGKVIYIKNEGIPKGKIKETLKDPILLYPYTAPKGLNDKILQGAWIGIQATDSNGRPVVQPLLYGGDGSMHFVPDNSNDPLLENIGVYVSSSSTPYGVTKYGLTGFDPDGNTMYKSADGSEIQPGQVTVDGPVN